MICAPTGRKRSQRSRGSIRSKCTLLNMTQVCRITELNLKIEGMGNNETKVLTNPAGTSLTI